MCFPPLRWDLNSFRLVKVLPPSSSVQVCRYFNEATKATVIWRKLASETQKASGFLVLDPFKLQNLPNCSSADLREAVFRTRFLEENWLKDYAKPLKTLTLNMAGFERPSTWQAEDQTRYFISERFVITASPGCLIEALDLHTRTIMKSNYRVSDEPEGAVLSPNFALENTSLYFAEYHHHTTDDDDISKWVVISKFIEELHWHNLIILTSRGPLLSSNIVCVQMHPLFGGEGLTAYAVAQFSLRGDYTFKGDAIDPSSRRICVLLIDNSTSSLCLYVIYDWESMSSTKIIVSHLVSIVYEFKQQWWLIIVYKPNVHSIARKLHLFEKDLHAAIYSPSTLSWCSEQSYRLEPLQDHANPWPPDTVPHSLFMHSRCEIKVLLQGSFFGYDGLKSIDHYQLPQQRLIASGCKPILCHLHVCMDDYREDWHDKREPRWAIVQYYAESFSSGILDLDQVSPTGYIEPMRNPVRCGQVPLLGISFTHAVWIEEFQAYSIGRVKMSRVLKLLSFASFTGRNADQRCAVALNIPEKVLNDAKRLFIEPSVCSIIIITERGEKHKFTFACKSPHHIVKNTLRVFTGTSINHLRHEVEKMIYKFYIYATPDEWLVGLRAQRNRSDFGYVDLHGQIH